MDGEPPGEPTVNKEEMIGMKSNEESCPSIS
jgi:hypothetical protein